MFKKIEKEKGISNTPKEFYEKSKNSKIKCDEFWLKKIESSLKNKIEKRKIQEHLKNWEIEKNQKRADSVLKRSLSKEHSYVFGRVFYNEKFTNSQIRSQNKFEEKDKNSLNSSNSDKK